MPSDRVGIAIGYLIGAFVLYIILKNLIEMEPGFAQFGGAIFLAFIAGAVIYLRSRGSG